MIIWLVFFLFLQTKPSFSTLFAWSQLDISATLDSVSAMSEVYQITYRWILKLLSWPIIFKLLNLGGNQLIMYTLAAYVFVPSVFGENIPTGRNCLLGHTVERK